MASSYDPKKGGEAPLNLLDTKRKIYLNKNIKENLNKLTVAKQPEASPPAPILTSAGGFSRKLTSGRSPLDDVTNKGGAKKKEVLGRSFAITVRLGRVHVDKELVYAVSPDCTEYCITLERGQGTFCNNHIHCYFKFVKRFSYLSLVQHYTDVFEGTDFSVHVESIKNLSHYLKYITKEDAHPLYDGVNENSFSFYYHCVKQLSVMPVWDVSHWFVVKHCNYYKYLEQLWCKLHVKYSPIVSYIWPWIGLDVDWFLKLESWYCNFVSIKFFHKKRHCYLHGPSNVGKSTAVKLLLSCLFDRVYYAADQHPFGGYDSKIHKAIVFEEFDYKKYDMYNINKCLEGSPFYINQKYVAERLDICQVPVIFVSNNDPPDFEPFLNRVVVISAYSFVQFTDHITEEVTSVIEGIEDAVSDEEEEI